MRHWRLYIYVKVRGKRMEQRQLDVDGDTIAEAMDAMEGSDRFDFAASGINKKDVIEMSFTIKERI